MPADVDLRPAVPSDAEAAGAMHFASFVETYSELADAEFRERELTNLYVLARYQGAGIGRVLLEAVLPVGAPAQLWVARGNPRAVRFYEREGFTADGASVDGAGFGGIAALRMVR